MTVDSLRTGGVACPFHPDRRRHAERSGDVWRWAVVDAAYISRHTVWPHVITELMFYEAILVALPKSHVLAISKSITWKQLRSEIFLVQSWDESQAAREIYASFLGRGMRYRTHAASKQSILALVGAGFGVTLVTESQAEVQFPGVVFKPIAEKNAVLKVDLVWVPKRFSRLLKKFFRVGR